MSYRHNLVPQSKHTQNNRPYVPADSDSLRSYSPQIFSKIPKTRILLKIQIQISYPYIYHWERDKRRYREAGSIIELPKNIYIQKTQIYYDF